MIRYALGAAFALLLCTITLLAAEYKDAKLKSVDTDKGTVTITVTKDGKETDMTLKYDKDKVKITANKKGEDVDVKDGFSNKRFSKEAIEKKAPTLTVTTEGEKDKETITKVYVGKKKE